MIGRRGRAGLLPPFLAGLAAAVGGETAAGLLLYTDEGLLPALTLILAMETGALALGLWSGSVPLGASFVEQIRRRWLFTLMAFALAAALSAGFAFMEDLPGSGMGQGLGLALFGGLPLFSIGSLLGAMGSKDEDTGLSLPAVGVPAVLGAATGFVLAGMILLPRAEPYTLFLSCLVLLSGGALLQGWVLDGHPQVRVLEVVPAVTGELRAEGRASGSPRRELRVLVEGGRLRGAEDPEGNPGRPWERAVLEGVKGELGVPESALFLGGGSGTLPRLLLDAFPETDVQVVERSLALVRLARSHLTPWDGWDRLGLQVGDILTTAPSRGSFAMIVVDAGSLPFLGGLPYLRESDWSSWRRILRDGGVLALGGVSGNEGESLSRMEPLLRGCRTCFPEVRVYETASPSSSPGLLLELDGLKERLLLAATAARPWPPSLSGFGLTSGEET